MKTKIKLRNKKEIKLNYPLKLDDRKFLCDVLKRNTPFKIGGILENAKITSCEGVELLHTKLK